MGVILRYFDLHVSSSFSEGISTIDQIVERSNMLGFHGVCIIGKAENLKKVKETRESFSKKEIELFVGFKAESLRELSKLVGKRTEFDILVVSGGDLRLNRKAVETPEVDILSMPEYRRKDSGFNHTMAKIATKNNVAVEINFREVLNSFKKTRSQLMERISTNIMLCKKYKTPIVITSGAVSHLHMRDPVILQSLAVTLGMELHEAREAIARTPEKIIKKSMERQSKDWIMPGVKVVK